MTGWETPLQTLLLTLVLAFAGMGGALLIHALPFVPSVQALLESTWTRGKPLNCWTCMVGWCSLAVLILLHAAQDGCGPDCFVASAAWLGAIGIGAPILRQLVPLFPVGAAPEVDEEE